MFHKWISDEMKRRNEIRKAIIDGSHVSERGFAIIDALVAVVVLAIGLTAALDMIGSLQVEMDMTRKYMLMGLLAQSKLEQLDAAAALPTASTGTNLGTEYPTISNYAAFTYDVVVDPVTSAGHASSPATSGPYNLTGKSVKITVTMYVDDLNTNQHQVSLSTIKTIRGG